MKHCFVSVLLALLLVGCATTSLTNLTATQQPRNPNNQYLIEYQWDSNQQTIRPDSIKPTVVVGFDTYPMRPTVRMTNRWETWVPVPDGVNSITYHFKVDYLYNRFGEPGSGSLLSPEYKLTIVEP